MVEEIGLVSGMIDNQDDEVFNKRKRHYKSNNTQNR